jgi:hypothetical protein
MFWDAPGASVPREQVRGIYGYNTPVQPVVGVVRRPRCELLPSTGVATVQGYVRYRGTLVFGAYVKANCQHTLSVPGEPSYRLQVKAGGRYKVVARYEDLVRGKVLYGERVTGKSTDPPLAPGSVTNLDITLLEPPEVMRHVIVKGQVRVDDVYLTGADHADTFYTKTLYVQWGVAIFNENTGAWDLDPDDPVALARRSDVATTGAGVGDSNAGLKIEVVANADLSVDVTLTGTLNPGDDDLSEVHTVHVPKDATVTVPEFDLDTGGPFNDRAYFRGITITNAAASAI